MIMLLQSLHSMIIIWAQIYCRTITIDRNMGTMVAFNNSTEVWHSVEPVYQANDVFAVWFKESMINHARTYINTR